MSVIRERSAWLLIGFFWAILVGSPAAADDTELFIAHANVDPGSRPNILFLIDTSGSMNTQVLTQATYDPTVTYAGTCDPTRVYWQRGGRGRAPSCGRTDRWFNKAALKCAAALAAFKTAGTFINNMAQFNSTSSPARWNTINQNIKDEPVECQDDNGIDGDGVNTTAVYAVDGNAAAPWSDTPPSISWASQRSYTVYDGNYLNWQNGPTAYSTRIDVVKEVATALLDSVNNVNIGLMRYNHDPSTSNDEGGSVIHAVTDISGNRQTLKDAIAALPAEGTTPLSESFYEAALYYLSNPVDYGDLGPIYSVPESRQPGGKNYKSPIEYQCQKNFVVMLTDGAPTNDTSANTKVPLLPNYGSAVGGNTCSSNAGVGANGMCLDDIAKYLYNADLDPNLDGKQNVTTYTIGFTVDLPLLADTAAAGGGAYFTVTDTASLAQALTSIVAGVLDTATTFTAPTVSVNSFNRTQNLNDLFISVFRASGNEHWPGNLKKYRLRASDGAIVDQNGLAAVDAATGFFTDTAQSFWSPVVDGNKVVEGGAANRLPAPDARRIYTYLGTSQTPNTPLSNDPIDTSNAAITDAMLGTSANGSPSRADVINFIRGWDVADVDQDNITAEPRNQMGDPLHSQPTSIIYGGSVQAPVAVVYFATNDGYLHAIDPTTGVEKWAFVPREFLPDQIDLLDDPGVSNKHYGIDGNLQLQVKLNNDDGIIDAAAGEKVYLFFGARRGGSFYYGLDVTNPDAPVLMWRRDDTATSLPGLGQSWSAPTPAQINIQNAGNPDNLVLVFGGGYDTSQDNYNGSTDTVGHSVFIVDSTTGAPLWRGSDKGANANFADMLYSIPSSIKVVDLNGDHLADRMYAADMGGQVWRFDIANGSSPNNLVTGGVIAQLGGAPNVPPAISDTRRFYYAPDVALVNTDSGSFLHIGIGSGHRAHPNSVFTQDRFYALRDYKVFGAMPQSYYDTLTPIKDADLVDITDDVKANVPAGSPGWRLELREGGWHGEKVLAESRTFNNQIFFTTFTPGGGSNTNCEPTLGTNRLYIVSLFNGAPVTNLDGSADSTDLTTTDRYTEFRGSISSEVVFMFPSPDDANCVGDQCTPPPVACVDLFCFPTGFSNNPVRTRWSESSVE